MALPYGTIFGDFGDEKRASSDPIGGNPLGTRMLLPDGRVFRHAFSQGALGAGQLCMQKAGQAANDMDLVIPSAVAVGEKNVTVTLGAGSVTADQFAGGYLYVNDDAGEGHIYRVSSHPAASSSANVVITLEDGDGIAEALTTASLVGLMENPYQDVEVWDADDIDGTAVGVAPTEVADNTYCWLQTWGPAAVLIEASTNGPVVGMHAVASNGTDGAVEGYKEDSTLEYQIVGVFSLIAAVDTDYGVVELRIAP